MNKPTFKQPCGHGDKPAAKSGCGDPRKACEGDAVAACRVQPFPTKGRLHDNLDLSLQELTSRVGDSKANIRAYIMTSVKLDQNRHFEQQGSGPNFQGGCLTLCTCMFQIRAEPKVWNDWWFAGLTRVKLPSSADTRYWLFYLAQVARAYDSYSAIWESLSENLKEAKSASLNRLGDVYQPSPSSTGTDRWTAGHYDPPTDDHTHVDQWGEDIENMYYGRHPALLVAKSEKSFLWKAPKLFLKKHPRNKTWDMKNFLGQLAEGSVQLPGIEA